MDMINFVSKFTTGIVGTIITKIVKKTTGRDIKVSVRNLEAKVEDKVRVKLDLDLELTREELASLVSKIGL